MPDEQAEAARSARARVGWPAFVLDTIAGIAELATLFITVASTAVALPPAGAPRARYQHIVNLYSTAVLVTVVATLVFFLVRRRWVAVVIQALVVVIAAASVVLLHKVRLTGGGLTGGA